MTSQDKKKRGMREPFTACKICSDFSAPKFLSPAVACALIGERRDLEHDQVPIAKSTNEGSSTKCKSTGEVMKHQLQNLLVR